MLHSIVKLMLNRGEKFDLAKAREKEETFSPSGKVFQGLEQVLQRSIVGGRKFEDSAVENCVIFQREVLFN